ncbi:MAG: fumarylacetoacetase [Pseudomonadota bacterium]
MPKLNETHDPNLTSWVESANAPDCDFTIQNLPVAIFRRRDSDERFRGGIAIGDQVLDLAAVSQTAAFDKTAEAVAVACTRSDLNEIMALGSAAWSALRLASSRALRTDSADREALRGCLLPQADVEYALPCSIGDYTDFFASIHHATKTGRLFRPENPLAPNYKWIPISYHGRSSSIGLSGDPVHRPTGQSMRKGDTQPQVGPSQRLDHELELGIFVGPGNPLGTPIDIRSAEDHVFGVCLLNDWSARDIQAWESRPLGPFLGKNFMTTISPWIVTMEALAPYRAASTRPATDAEPSDYLRSATNDAEGAINIHFEVLLQTSAMRSAGLSPEQISTSNFVDCYWTISQMIAHHTVNGCNLRPGDLLGSGTQSGPGEREGGCLLELSRGGKTPIALANGETRRFLEDGDTVVFRAWCEQDGAARIGLGELANTIQAA